jgi:hypothetical protein
MCGVTATEPYGKFEADVLYSAGPGSLASGGPLRKLVAEVNFYTAGGLDVYFGDLRHQFDACSDSSKRDPALAPWTYSPLSFPDLGDNTFTVSATTQESSHYTHMIVCFIRRGELLAVLSYYSSGEPNDELTGDEIDLVKSAARAADKRLAEAQRQLN